MFKKAIRGKEGSVDAVETYDGQVLELPEAVNLLKSEIFTGAGGDGRRGREFVHNYLDWLAEKNGLADG